MNYIIIVVKVELLLLLDGRRIDMTKSTSNNLVKITFPNGEVETYTKGIKLEDIVKEKQPNHKHTIVAAKIDNRIKELRNEINEDCKLEFIDLTSADGMRIYQRSLSFYSFML